MKKRMTIALVFALIFLTGCFGGGFHKTVEQVDPSMRIINYTQEIEEGNYTTQELYYIKDSQMYQTWFIEVMRPSLDWLRANTKPSDKIFTWWDNGHIIRGYAHREPVAYAPCKEIEQTLADKWNVETMGPYSNKEDLTNVAYALLADSPIVAQGIMRRYSTKYAYVPRMDQKKIEGMTILLGEDIKNYVDDVGDPKEGVKTKVLFRMADGWPVKGFNKVYEDDYVNIYELTG
jgi:asparagine N-glycosylation enzyme membrane subunit Stt3